MNTQYEQALSDHNYADFRFAELDSNSTESKVISPVQEGKNSIVFNENGWKHTADILKRIPELVGDYILYFELDDEKWSYNEFCMVVLRVIQDRNSGINLNIEVARNRSKDGINHFWLLKK